MPCSFSSRLRGRGRWHLGAIRLLGCALAATVVSMAPARGGAVAAQGPPGARLYQDSRAEIALARARGDATITLVIAAREGGSETVARDVAAVGGTVRVRYDEVGYLRAEVPIDQADVAEGKAVEGVAVDVAATTALAILAGPRHLPPYSGASDGNQSSAGPSSPHQAPQASQLSDAPFTHPYSPVKDLGAADLRRLHPTYDGRGITIGHVERVVDLLIPEFETAYTLDGRETPKIVDVRTTTDPDHTHGAGSRRIWTKLDLKVTAAGGRFTVEDATYTAPRDRRFRFGMFDGAGMCAVFLTRRDAAATASRISQQTKRTGCSIEG